jgi:exodeoxyribonuclease V beta subunit
MPPPSLRWLDEMGLLQTMARFSGYRETWLRRGFGVMLRAWMASEAVALRLLARATANGG